MRSLHEITHAIELVQQELRELNSGTGFSIANETLRQIDNLENVEIALRWAAGEDLPPGEFLLEGLLSEGEPDPPAAPSRN